MIPLIVDPRRVAIALVGRGAAAERRLAQLLEGGAQRLLVFSDAPAAGLVARAGEHLRERLPRRDELRGIALVWIADLPAAVAAPLGRLASAAGCLVNVEDATALCDFHNPAQVRRGDLLLTVSTGGRSPGLAARLRRELARSFGPEWAARLDRLATQRQAWRRSAPALDELGRLTDAAIDVAGWLPKERDLERARAS